MTISKVVALTWSLGIVALSQGCQPQYESLPILGHRDFVDGDTVYHIIPDFEFLNVDSTTFRNSDLDDHIYIADFFFTSCPSICPKVKKQMLRLYGAYKNEDIVKFVSHTIDPKRDTPGRLKLYAKNLEVDTDKWIFLTGTQDSLLDIANAYFVPAYIDPEVPGGFDHSGKLILVDKKRHIRAVAEGTDPKSVTAFFRKIDALIAEYRTKETS